jgi:bacillithiol biosynthesis deacetylase BshB1
MTAAKPLDVLVVAPHPDDAELGMGATTVKMLREGLAVGVLDLTNGEPTPLGSPEIRARETAAATEVLGLEWRENLGLENRRLEPSLGARAKLAEVIRRMRPRWLFAPYWIDAHPDHVATTELVEAARFWAKLTKTDLAGEPHYPERIFYYYCTHLRLIPQPAFIVDVSETYELKQAALECYRSQLVEGQPPEPLGLIDRLREAAATWGFLIGARYGEPFTCREPVGLAGFGELK